MNKKGGKINMKTILGVFDTHPKADALVRDLYNHNYTSEHVSVMVKEGVVKDLGPSMVENVAEKTVGGVATGGVVGGLAGLLVGLGALAVPGFGAVLIGGPIAAALGLGGAAATTVSAAATGAFAGGIVGALGAIGLPEESVKVYEEQLRQGGVVVAVDVDNDTQADEVRHLFESQGADNLKTVEK